MQRYKESTKQRNYFFHPASMQIQLKPVVRNRKTGGRFRTGTIHRPIWGKSIPQRVPQPPLQREGGLRQSDRALHCKYSSYNYLITPILISGSSFPRLWQG